MIIKTKKNIDNIRIVLASDFHIVDNLNMNRLLRRFECLNADYICIPGDLVDFVNKENVLWAVEFLKCLTKFVNRFIIISIGNHEFYDGKDNNNPNESVNYFINSINSISKVKLLNNDKFLLDNINFIGCTADYDFYKKYYENGNMLVESINNRFIVNNNNYNILLFHSPISFLKDENLDRISFVNDLDLVLFGHMHRGCVLGVFSFLFGKNRGFIDPHKRLFPKYARGVVYKKNFVSVISGGIRVFSKLSGIFNIFNIFFKPDIKIIDVKKAND